MRNLIRTLHKQLGELAAPMAALPAGISAVQGDEALDAIRSRLEKMEQEHLLMKQRWEVFTTLHRVRG